MNKKTGTLDSYLIKIFEKYKPNKNLCRPTVNPDIDNTENRDNLEIACLLLNLKKVYFTRWLDTIENMDTIFKPILKKLKIQTIIYKKYYLSKPKVVNKKTIMIPTFHEEDNALMFASHGKTNALLFLKKDLENNIQEFHQPGSWAELNNPYLIGTLLEYPKKDIKFFYMINEFKQIINSKSFDKPFIHWSDKIKQKFELFKQKKWMRSESYNLYIRDRQETNIWIKQNNIYSIQELENQISKLNFKIEDFQKNYFKT